MIETVCDHSFDADLLTEGGWILDVGCLHSAFSDHFLERGYRVIGVDSGAAATLPPGLLFENSALVPSGFGSVVDYVVCRRHEECNHVVGVGIDPGTMPCLGECGMETVTVPAITLPALMAKHGVERFDLAKFDCEGCEVLLLESGRFARQISLELHTHMGQAQDAADRIIGHLLGLGYRQATDGYYDKLFIL